MVSNVQIEYVDIDIDIDIVMIHRCRTYRYISITYCIGMYRYVS